jgi:hypothetical protein
MKAESGHDITAFHFAQPITMFPRLYKAKFYHNGAGCLSVSSRNCDEIVEGLWKSIYIKKEFTFVMDVRFDRFIGR